MALYGVTNVSAASPALNNVATTVKTMLQASRGNGNPAPCLHL